MYEQHRSISAPSTAASCGALVEPWLKALHVAAAIAFLAGVLSVSLFAALIYSTEMPSTLRARSASFIRLWDQAVTTPAMLLVWAFGIGLALRGGWFGSFWLMTKLVVVLGVSGLHGFQSAMLRRLATDNQGNVTGSLHRAAPFVIGAAVLICILAIVKPG